MSASFFISVLVSQILALTTSTQNGPPSTSYCLTQDPEPYRQYSTKTPYTYAENILPDNTSWGVEGCTALHLYALLRHGTRYAGLDDITDIREKLPVLQLGLLRNSAARSTEFCDSDMDNIRSWEPRMVTSDAKELADVGWAELRQMGQRLKTRFAGLFEPGSNVNITHTKSGSLRTRDSARALAEGALGSYGNANISEHSQPDWLLDYKEACEDMGKPTCSSTECGPTEQEKFAGGPEIQGVIQRVNRRLGLLADYNDTLLDYDDVLLLYQACRVEYGIYGTSPWCAVFHKTDLQILEYYEDLEYFHEDGYGAQSNYLQACGVLADVMSHFKEAMQDADNNQGVTVRVGHSDNLNNMFALLGLFRDERPLEANNYASQASRQWRTSLHTPYSSNVMAVLYHCPGGGNHGNFTVRLFENERPAHIPGATPRAPDTGFVYSYQYVEEAWAPTVESCDQCRVTCSAADIGPRRSIAVWCLTVLVLGWSRIRRLFPWLLES